MEISGKLICYLILLLRLHALLPPLQTHLFLVLDS
jgi:hypothetical protein